MIYRKQTQHIRRYKSGTYTFINRGITYKQGYKKTFGSQFFRSKIENEINFDRSVEPRHKELIVRTIEKNPHLLANLKGVTLVSSEEDYHGGITPNKLFINKRIFDRPIYDTDPLTKSERNISVKDVLEHESTHLRQLRLNPSERLEHASQLAIHTDLRREKTNQGVINHAVERFFSR